MTDDSETMRQGFRAGYRRYMGAAAPSAILLPNCPYPLRTRERTLWLTGHGRGRSLAQSHRDEHDRVAVSLEALP